MKRPTMPLAGRARAMRADVADVAAALRGEQGEADKGRESRAAVRVGKAGDLLRPADADRAAEHALHVIGDVLELGAAAGQHDLAADGAGEAELLERRLDLVGQLFDRAGG